MTTKQSVCLRKLRSVYLSQEGDFSGERTQQYATTLIASMVSYGFCPSKQFYEALFRASDTQIVALHNELLPLLAEEKGAHVKHKPMYVNFPAQVMEMDQGELFINAMLHYWSGGEWKPEYDELPRPLHFESAKWVELGLADDSDLLGVFPRLLASNDSLSASDRELIEWFIREDLELSYPETIPFKENMAVVAALFLEHRRNAAPLVKTSTDVLRIATYLSGGDVSLATNTRFKSFRRQERRALVRLLESVLNPEDLVRHKNKWVRLFHSLHVGDYSRKVYEAAALLRNNEKVTTYNSRVEQKLQSRDPSVTDLLKQRPGEFARRIDHLLRVLPDPDQTLREFENVAEEVSSRVLTSLCGHFKNRSSDTRIVFPKGSAARARRIKGLPSLDEGVCESAHRVVRKALINRFSKLEPLGDVWISEKLQNCPLPTAQRSASDSTNTVARGTRLPFGDETKSVLRFFIYWVGRDLDLSATLHSEDFTRSEHISYTRLKSSKIQACHSGDITRAPHGASEFIDISIDDAVKAGYRYVVMNVFVYSGPNFSEHETCFAGWMTRSEPKSNEIYDPKTVEGKIDLASNSRNAIPAVFDLQTREAIWADLITSRRSMFGGNNIESNTATIEDKLRLIVGLSDSQMSLYELFSLHAEARGNRVADPEEADRVYALTRSKGQVSPFDINLINSEYLE